MTKLYFIRHGKTEWNLAGRYQGSKGDSPLLKSSYAEINDLAEFLKDINFRRIYTSPLRRAVITGRTLQHKLDQLQGYVTDLTISNRLREFNLGRMEGMEFTKVAELYPEELDGFRNHPEKYNPSKIDGESFPQLIQRMTPAIIHIVSEFNQENDNVIIVSHGAALNALINSLLGVELAHLRDRGGLANTSTTILETKDMGSSFKLLDWNDTQYLNHEQDPTDLI